MRLYKSMIWQNDTKIVFVGFNGYNKAKDVV